MSVTDQPSILTVCVPGTSADLGALDLNQVLAARRKAAGQSASRDSDGADCLRPDCSKSRSECAACDDSACGVKVVGDPTSGVEVEGRRISGDEADPVPNEPGTSLGVSFFHADSGKKALELLRMLRFDLLVTGDRLPDMPIGHFLRRVRVAWPWQKWAMVGSSITAEDEIAARALGAMAVFDAPPDWEVLSSLAVTAADQAAGLKLASPHGRGAKRLQRLGDDQNQLHLADRTAV
jgi:hypothetical protein